jgi:hypothetical protein
MFLVSRVWLHKLLIGLDFRPLSPNRTELGLSTSTSPEFSAHGRDLSLTDPRPSEQFSWLLLIPELRQKVREDLRPLPVSLCYVANVF